MDPALVPGVLVSSLPLAAQGSLLDLAPTVLEYLGADASDLKGANLFVKKK